MSRLSPAAVDGNAFHKAMGHRPEIVEKWYELDGAMRFSGTLEPALKEEVRRSLAEGVGCRFCASLGPPEPLKPDKRAALAVAFADAVFSRMGNLQDMDEEAFDVLRSEFSEPEIVELVVWTLFMIAGSAFGAIMKVRPASPTEFQEYQEWRAAGEARARAAA